MIDKIYPQRVRVVVSANIDDTEIYIDNKLIDYTSAFTISHKVGNMPEVSITFYPDEVELISENKEINQKFLRT